MQTPYSQQVADTFSAAQGFGEGRATLSELGALRMLYRSNGRDRTATLQAIETEGYPLPDEITPDMVALTGAAHACGVAIHLAEERGPEGKDSTYESYTTKNRFDRFTALHLPKALRNDWNASITRVPDASPKVTYPASADIHLIHGVGKPSRYLPAQTMRNLEFARLGKLEAPTKDAMKISDVDDLSKFAIKWDSLIPTIESAESVIQLAGALGAEIGRQLLHNGLQPEQVAAILKKSYSTRGIKEEHGDIEEADRVYRALVFALSESHATEELSRLLMPELPTPKPSIFPHLAGMEKTVPPGEYKLLDGSDEPAHIRKGQIYIITEGDQLFPDVFSGIHNRGIYNSEGWGSREGKTEPIVSFLYHKLDADGNLETMERAIIVRGVGYGVHPGHKGQEPTWYLVGPQIGTIDPETGKIVTMPEEDGEIPAKHFSVACITNGPLGKPILANPV